MLLHFKQWSLKSALVLLLCLASTLLCVSGRDYYDVLSVSRQATESQIKRAYRKLALQYHPDKVTGTEDERQEAQKKFAEINNAYETLMDPKKRQIYNVHGEEGLRQHNAQQGGGGGGGGIFDWFFHGNQQAEEEQVPKGHDVNMDLWVSLKDLYLGKEIQVVRDKDVIRPAPGSRRCKCKNQVVTKQIGPGMYQQYTTQTCETCDNVRMEREQEVITVHVEPGMINGQVIKFFEEGEPMVDGEAGDLHFIVKTLPHATFRREGNDLHMGYTISLLDALTGFSHEVTHLDGHKVNLTSSKVIIPGEVQHIAGEGMPQYGDELKFGDLVVTYTIQFPSSLTDKQQQELKAILQQS